MVRLQIQVTESQYSRIRKEAFKQKVPISKFIRSLIDMSFSVPHSSKSAKRAFFLLEWEGIHNLMLVKNTISTLQDFQGESIF